MQTIGFIHQVGAWWEGLDLARQIFYGLGLLAGLVAVSMTALSLIGIEFHDAADALDGADVDHGGGGIFSVKPLTGFFLGFGWSGGMALDAGLSLLTALLVALATGGLIMAVVVAMFRAIYALRSDGTRQIGEAVGAVGTVYVTVQPRKAGGGQAVVNFSGRQETLAALSAADRPIASGEKIRVVGVLDSRTVLVEPL